MKKFNANRVLCWRLILLKEYGPKLHFIKGKRNTVADVLSQQNLESSNTPVTSDAVHMAELFAVDNDELLSDAFPLTKEYCQGTTMR